MGAEACWAQATCSTWPAAPVFRCARCLCQRRWKCTGGELPGSEQGGEPDYIEGVLEGGNGRWRRWRRWRRGRPGAARKTPVRPGRGGGAQRIARPAFRWCNATLKIGYNRARAAGGRHGKAGLVSAMSTNGQRDIPVPLAWENHEANCYVFYSCIRPFCRAPASAWNHLSGRKDRQGRFG